MFKPDQNKSPTRTGEARLFPENIDTQLCTHIIYAYATLDEKALIMKSSRPDVDIDMSMYERVTNLKKLGKKVSIALGGVNDTQNAEKYSKLLNDATARKNFITNAIEFVTKYNFDGLDLVFLVS